ncbi:MAG: ArsA family ATPase [Myxococcota bacterium]
MTALLDHRFLFVVGKGGVGKTTVAATLGLAAAARGKRVLIAMTNAKERLSTLLGVPPIGSEIANVAPGLDAVNMTPEAAIEEYGMMILKVRALYSALFENRLVRAFLRGTPGIESWAMLGKAYFHAVGHGPDGVGEYDLVLLDAPATGHGLDMLRVPSIIVDVAPPGLLRREAERALSLFQDRTRAGAVLVALPEEMPANETIELHASLEELRIRTQALIVNQMLPLLIDEQALGELEAILPPEGLETLVEAGRVRGKRERVQRTSLRILSSIDAPRHDLPHLFDAEFARGQIDQLDAALRASLEPRPPA